MKRFDREELAWAAGFFDGEGCTYTSVANSKRTTKGKSISFDIAQTDRYVLDRFTNALGIGKVYGPYPGSGKGKNHKDYYRYTLYGFEKCQSAIAMLWNNLSPIKRQQASIALEVMRKYYSEPRVTPGPKPILKDQEIVEVKFLIGKIPTREIAFLYGISMGTVWTIKSKGVKYAQ